MTKAGEIPAWRRVELLQAEVDRVVAVEKTLKEMREAHAKQFRRAEAAEAKLAEDAHRNDQLKRERDKYRAKLAEAEEDAEEARKVRGALSLAAPAGYAVAHIKQLQADLENANEHADNAERAIKELEAKLAEVERILNKSVTSRKATEKRLAEVEKERNEWKEDAILTHSEYIDLPPRASLDRARELAEEIAKDPRTGQVDHWATAAGREIARLLSGDE